MSWKKGRGALGALQPLLGRWRAAEDSPRGPMVCIREFESVLGGKAVRMTARWEFPEFVYEELAVFSPLGEGAVGFWSFTSDGKRSKGRSADVSDLHPDAVGFEADMPAGVARQAWWPDGDDAVFVVESRTKTGWNRFVEHRCRRV